MSSNTCNPVRDDVNVSYGENHSFNLQFTSDRDLTNALCTLTIKPNNSHPDADAVHREQRAIVNKGVVFIITPDQCRQIGEGKYWYDIWVKDGDGYEKPLVQGVLTIPYRTTRAQS